jgi:hypothetical protein
MANGFGAYTDHFGILAIVDGVGTLADVLEITGSSKTPDANSMAQAVNENGDPEVATWYGNTAGELFAASSTFVCKSGDFDLALIKGGEVAAGKVIDSIQVGTSNDGWPQITVSGKLGAETIVAPTGLLNTWSLPSITIYGAMRAQLLDFTIGATCALTASSLSGQLNLSQANDGEGEPAAHGISGGMLTVTANMVYITAEPSWTPGVDWTENQAPGIDESQAAYHTTSASAQQIWARDVAP